MRQIVESEKSKSYGNRLAETGSLIKQEEKQQQGMVLKPKRETGELIIFAGGHWVEWSELSADGRQQSAASRSSHCVLWCKV